MAAPALSYCGEQVKRFDKDRFTCALFLPNAEREKIFTLLAFNQEIAKISQTVSEPLPGLIRLQWWRDAIDGIYQNDPRQHEVVHELYRLIQEHPLTRQLFDDLLTAREQDLDETLPKNIQDLLEYAEHTSGNLFMLMLEALGIRDTQLLQAAKHLGIAWSLTGMMRSLKFSANKRLMLPEDMLMKKHLTKETILAGENLAATKPAVKLMVETARRYVQDARKYRKRVPKQALGIFLPAVMVDIHLKRIRKANYDLFTTDLERHPGMLHVKLLKSAVLHQY